MALPIALAGVLFAEIPSNAADLVLPISFDRHSTPMISVEIAGTAYQLSLDTGSEEGLHLRPDLLDRIEGIRFTGEMQRSSDMAGNVQENARFVIDALSVSGRVFRDIQGVKFSPWGLTVQEGSEDSQPAESSVVGLGFFKGHRILIDYDARELTIFDAASGFDPDRDKGWIEVPFRHSQEGLVLEALIGGEPHDMVLDTGATMSFAVADHIADTASAASCQSIYPSLQQEGCRLIRVDTRFGDTATSFHALLIEDDPGNFQATGLLGGDFLQHHAVFVDFGGKRMYVRPDQSRQD